MSEIIELEKWLKNDNALISNKLQVKTIPGRGRSVLATEHIPKGTKVIELPRRTLLNIQTVGDLPQSWKSLSSHQLLALYICTKCKDTNDKWSVFFKCLPTMEEVSTVPLTWDHKKSRDIRGPVAGYVEKQRRKFEADYKAAYAVETIDKQEFLWAWLCVNSRCIYMSLGLSKEDNLTMAPYVDYLNHSDHGEETVIIDINAQSMTVVTTKEYNEGEEVYLSYGAHDNLFLLCEYGFILQSNKWDSLDITEELIRLMNGHHRQVLQDLGYFGEYTVTTTGPSFRTEIALACLQEHRPTEVPRSLQLMVDGFSDGQKFKLKSRAILRGILESIKEDIINRHNDIYRSYIHIINTILE